MSKLYKELKYDTDRVMQPGDPLTSFDGNTAIKAGNATGKGFIETYGEPVAYSYEVTVDIPQVSGASARIRLKDVDETTIDVEILSIEGFPGAEIDSNTSSHIKLNGASWGYVNCNPAWEGSTYPDYTIIPIGFGGRICVLVNPTSADSEYCHWSDLEQTRQLVSSKEISTEGHTHTEIVSPDGNTSVQAVNGGKATITMPGLAEPGASLSNDVTLEDLIQRLDLPETSTLDDVRTALGLSETATLYDASVTPITKTLATSPVRWDKIANKPDIWPVSMGGTGVDGSSQSANKVLASPSSGTGAVSFRALVAADIPNLNTSKLTAGTLGVARGGTGKGTHTVNSVIIGGTSTTGALQNVAAASGAFYSTGTNVKPKFGTLPVAQGGTGVNGSSQAINKVLASPASGSAGAISFRSLVEADIPTLSTSKISGLGNAATKNVGTASGTVAAGDHTHGAANISYDDNASYNTVAACLTDLVNTNLWVENNATNIMRGDETLSTLTLNGKTIATTGDLNILPITTSIATTLALNTGTYMYKVTDSGATGTFPTLTAPTGLPASCYYKFEMEWVTASPTATYAQTASTTPAMKWISSPVMQTDGLSHTYHISGRYDTTTSTFWMSCWKIDDAQGAITPDSHTLKYLLTTPTQTTSTTTNTNDTITVQLSDHAINSVNVPVSVTNVVLKFPGQAVGKARDFMVRLVVTGETVPSITLTEPDGSAVEFDVDDDSWTEIEQGVNLLMFTETAQ